MAHKGSGRPDRHLSQEALFQTANANRELYRSYWIEAWPLSQDNGLYLLFASIYRTNRAFYAYRGEEYDNQTGALDGTLDGISRSCWGCSLFRPSWSFKRAQGRKGGSHARNSE